MGEAVLVSLNKRQASEAAMLLLHGYGGDAQTTFGRLPEFLGQVKALAGWDIYSVGYTSTLSPDIRGVWLADPPIEVLAGYLRTRALEAPLERYKSLALIAHSLGGLVAQQALVDYRDFASRVSHVLFFGTPSGGITKARWIRFLKIQSQAMAKGSHFITNLRTAWQERFGSERPFKLWSVAGDRDHFVPAESSLGPFAKEDCLVIPGNHLEIVSPSEPTAMTVQVVTSCIVGDAAPGGPWNAARVAVEMGDFQRAIDRLRPSAGQLDDRHLVELALALDSTGKRDEAIRILKERASRGTDVFGVLAGRFKRRWMAHGRESDAREAMALYQEAYERSVQGENHAQAYYHGINLAFMYFAFAEADREDKAMTRQIALDVLTHCRNAKPTFWCAATVGDARLYLGDEGEALEAYRKAVAMEPTPREMESIYTQAYWVADMLGSTSAKAELERVFRGVATPSSEAAGS